MQSTKDRLIEKLLIDELKEGKEEAFSMLFRSYYANLVLYAGSFVPERSKCEDIVQTLFMKIWEERKMLNIEISLKAYLIRAVRNSCLDELKHCDIVRVYEEKQKLSYLEDEGLEEYIFYSDLQEHLQSALEHLPATHREAFELNRFSGLKYKEIAEKQGVSERSVEVRISKALQLLREHLKEFLTIMLLMLKNIFFLW